MFSLEGRYGTRISSQLVRQGVLFLNDATQDVLTIVEELVQFA